MQYAYKCKYNIDILTMWLFNFYYFLKIFCIIWIKMRGTKAPARGGVAKKTT